MPFWLAIVVVCAVFIKRAAEPWDAAADLLVGKLFVDDAAAILDAMF